MKPIQIYGAGISGLTAAINLSKNGYDVTVIEKEKRIGGSSKCTPSIHMTPMHFEKMKEYIGIDIEPCFTEIDMFKAYIYKKIVMFNPKKLYVTERGPNKTSLDYYLYQKAEEQGVHFEFSHPILKENIPTIPDGSIIATGGYSCLCKDLHIYHVPYLHYDGLLKSDHKRNFCLAYFDTYLAGYGYIAGKDGLLSAQVGFMLHQPHETYLQRFIKQLKETEQIELKSWSMVHDNYPGRTTLFKKINKKTYILTGVLSGFIDPLFGFGVNSAMIAGKIAASTVMSKKKGIQEFNYFTDRLNKKYLMSRIYDFLPFRDIVIPRFFSNSEIGLLYIKNTLRAIPGFVHDDCFEIESITDKH